MENVIIVLIILLITAGVIRYLLRAKKRGETCIGCPYSKKCGGGCSHSTQDTGSRLKK